jgi:large subunit ribosomal protein L10
MDTQIKRVRPEKQSIVAELSDRIKANDTIIFTDNVGMTTDKTGELRKRLRAVGGRYQVVPNGMVALAARKVGIPVADGLSGSTAAVFGQDPVELSRVLWGFVKENEKPAVKRVAISGVVHPGSAVQQLSQLPTRPILLSIFLGTLNAPMRNLAGALHQKLSSLVYVLQAVREKREAVAG